jgi:membrane-associated phospholipid phosphatase
MEVAYRDRRPAPIWLLHTAVIATVVTALCIVTIDEPVAHAVDGHVISVWDKGIAILEWGLLLPLWPWAGEIVIVAGMVITASVPRWRRQAPAWMFVAAVPLASRIVVNWIKVGTGRLRPSEWPGGDTFFRHGVSFPSGHVVLFASLAIPLAVVAPRVGRPLLLTIAFAAVARVGANAHFVSDTVGAVALVALIAWLVGLAIRPCTSSTASVRSG